MVFVVDIFEQVPTDEMTDLQVCERMKRNFTYTCNDYVSRTNGRQRRILYDQNRDWVLGYWSE